MEPAVYDTLIIGAGISGINAAYRIQEGLPDSSYAILEARHEMGGTWSLFKYPGIRSDSDLFTFGFSWYPWKSENPIATAPSILRYLREAASKYGIDRHIKYNHRVLGMNWSSESQRWEVRVSIGGGEERTFYCRFLALGTGYYDYNQGLSTVIPGIENFKGQTVHPQFWPENLDYTDKNVVIVGSGATAVTILPSMHEKAAHVTMLQRSPGYFVSLPAKDPVGAFAKRYLPTRWAGLFMRLKFLVQFHMFYYYCMLFPSAARRKLRAAVAKELPASLPLDPHFTPAYNPWEQRMCVTPQGDFFAALRSGKASVVTDTIDSVTESGIRLKSSGRTLDADIIVTATGLKFQLLGHAALTVDGRPVNLGDKFIWRGAMVQDVPNLALFMGYTNASWTLGADATARLMVRIIHKLRNKGVSSVVASMDSKTQQQKLHEMPFLGLKSGYVQAAMKSGAMPKCATQAPWRPRKSYFYDSWFAKYGSLEGLSFGPAVQVLEIKS